MRRVRMRHVMGMIRTSMHKGVLSYHTLQKRHECIREDHASHENSADFVYGTREVHLRSPPPLKMDQSALSAATRSRITPAVMS